MGFMEELGCAIAGHKWVLNKVDEIHWGTEQEGGIEKIYYYKCKECFKDMFEER